MGWCETLQHSQASPADSMETREGVPITGRLTCEAIGVSSVRKSVASPKQGTPRSASRLQRHMRDRDGRVGGRSMTSHGACRCWSELNL